MNPVQELAEFLIENSGVLVTSNSDYFVCQSCGRSNVFASSILHSDECVFEKAKAAVAKGKTP